MSASFIIKYGGPPLRLPEKTSVKESQATPFASEADAWYAAYQAGLTSHLCAVVPQFAEMEKDGVRDGVEPVLTTKEAA